MIDHFRKRSFERRDSRLTKGQKKYLDILLPERGLQLSQGLIDFSNLFKREAPCLLEIGFGMGDSLLAAALQHPDKNFLGIETHKPGVGNLLKNISHNAVSNLFIFNEDAVLVFEHSIKDESLDSIQIFFPDPWPKRKQHSRRLIQDNFVSLIVKKIKPRGSLHLATDWEDYAKQFVSVIQQQPHLHPEGNTRSIYRPVVTKFEKKALEENRQIWDFQFLKK